MLLETSYQTVIWKGDLSLKLDLFDKNIIKYRLSFITLDNIQFLGFDF